MWSVSQFVPIRPNWFSESSCLSPEAGNCSLDLLCFLQLHLLLRQGHLLHHHLQKRCFLGYDKRLTIIRAEQIPGTSEPPPTSTLGSGGRIWKGFPFKQNLVSKSLPSFRFTRSLFCFPSLHFVQMVHSRSECPAYMILFIFMSGNGISDVVNKTQHQFTPGFTSGFWPGFTSP